MKFLSAQLLQWPPAMAAAFTAALITLAAIILTAISWTVQGKSLMLMTFINPLLIAPVVSFPAFLAVYRSAAEMRAMRKALHENCRRAATNAVTKAEFGRLSAVETDQARRHQHPMAAIVFVVDRAARLIEEWGRDPFEDIVLESTARISRCLRDSDFIGRYGTHHLVIVLPNTGLAVANSIAQRISAEIGATPFPMEYTRIPVQVTLGVAADTTVRGDDPVAGLIAIATCNACASRQPETGENFPGQDLLCQGALGRSSSRGFDPDTLRRDFTVSR